jgi:hypothetical protein
MLTVTMRRCVALMWAALVFLLGLVTCRCRVVLGCLGELGGCGWSTRVVGGRRGLWVGPGVVDGLVEKVGRR